MARSLPCIGTNVGGIPELLHADDMVAADDAHALANKLQECLSSSERLAAMSRRNFTKAQDYQAEILQARRDRFYSVLRERTAEWIARKQ
jgi:glycosyltransferase involved in cell wall biosynthesis